MTQKEVAKALHISQASVSDIYRGVITDPKVSIADALRALHAQRVTGIGSSHSETGLSISSPATEPLPIDDWGSGDPRHGERRKPEQRSGHDRRVNGPLGG